MSMENGFELDFPGDDDNSCEFGCMPMDHGSIVEYPGRDGEPVQSFPIGEPDSASIDEMPRIVKEDDYWEKTRTEISKTEGHATHKLSFVTSSRYGADTTSVRLTQGEMIEAWYAIGNHLGLMPR